MLYLRQEVIIMAENKLADLSMDFAVSILKLTNSIIHRKNDIEDKWIIAPENRSFSKEEIADLVEFQEKFFDTEILM